MAQPQPATAPDLQYRSDIDGIRAIAVLAVVLFHLDLALFQGGYVGVDVFFVISGFLITSIIRDKQLQGHFGFADFYCRRIRRLLPALVATAMASLFGAALLMTPYDLAAMGRSTLAALFSLSNVLFYSEAGYWDSASELKPLLHTWSLGVEEQFYLLWPALIVFLLGARRRPHFALSLALITVAGYAVSVWYSYRDISAAFYLLPFRVYQFALGALAMMLAQSAAARGLGRGPVAALAGAGLGMIACSVLVFDSTTLFPGWAAMLPSLGAALLLLSGAASGGQARPVALLLQNPLSVWLGRVSYSMYLVHWPLIALYRYHYGVELHTRDQWILAAATLLGTLLLHHGVERRFYSRQAARAGQWSGRGFALATLLALVACGWVAGSAWRSDGWAWRLPQVQLTPQQVRDGQKLRFSDYNRACWLRDFPHGAACRPGAAVQVLVFGNSHEVDGYNIVRTAWGEERINFINFGNINACLAPARYPASEVAACESARQKLLQAATADALDLVVYAARRPYQNNKAGALDTLQRLQQLNPRLRLLTLGDYIQTRLKCARLINESGRMDACVQPDNVRYFANEPHTEPLYDAFATVQDHMVDTVALLCPGRELRRCAASSDGRVPMFYDESHFSLEFAQMVGRRLQAAQPELLQRLLGEGES